MKDPTNGLLGIALSAAVPLWIDRIQRQGGPVEADYARARECSQLLAEKGDILQFKSAKPGETAHVFNRLAEAMAIMAFCPGGIKFDGMHFEVKDGD